MVTGLGASRSTWQIGELSKYGKVLPSFVEPRRDSLALGCDLLKAEMRGEDVCSGGSDGGRDD